MSGHGAVLVASKEGAFLAMVQEVGNRLGYIVVPAVSSACAVDTFCGGNVRVMVVDASLADGPGVELVRRVRRMSPDAKLIFVMSEPSEDVERDVRAAGVSYLGCKPLDPELFGRVLQKVYEYETRRILRVGA